MSKIKVFIFLNLVMINLVFCQTKQDLKSVLTNHNLSGVITKDNGIFFYSPEDCKSYGCQACALQSSGEFEGWYQCQGLGLKRDYSSQAKEFAQNAQYQAKRFGSQAKITGKKFLSSVQETGTKIKDWFVRKYNELKSKETNK